MSKKLPPDQEQRELALSALSANMLIDAGAGTGKTATIVARLIAMVAPVDDGPAHRLERIAAVTFTRRAAGELRLRIRHGLINALAEKDLSSTRRGRLLSALGVLDTASVGTIHSFADRLLRLRPVEAELSPAYAIMEEPEVLVEEVFGLLMDTAQSGTLANELAGTVHADRALEVEETIALSLRVGLRSRTKENADRPPLVGLDGLVRGFVGGRDLLPAEPPAPKLDVALFRQHARDFIKHADALGNSERGDRWLRKLGDELRTLLDTVDAPTLLALGARVEGRAKYAPFKARTDFEKGDGWPLWKDLTKKDEDGGESLLARIVGPARQWLAQRLVRVMPIVIALYEKVKARRQAVDSIDLLLKLRDLLRNHKPSRAFYQGLFDHVFVDEFQDTDPLQAEILLYLCEHAPVADRWQDVVLGKGRLTIVGDPKQSIYRFRRADVAMYEQIRQQIALQEHVSIRLSANFRSTGPLVKWQNECFAQILGASPTGAPFDAATGQVFHQPLGDGRGSPVKTPCVHAVPYAMEDEKPNAHACRAVEASAMATYLRWLVEKSDIRIEDPDSKHTDSKEARPVRYSDIAVLGLVTSNLPMLFAELDRMGVPYAASGGTMFLRDHVHQQFILGLRALADSQDGVAQAALLRPPFFAVDLLDLVHERALDKAEAKTETERRARQALEWVQDARKERFARSPGTTARKLLDETAFARTVALGPNGRQRVQHLRELCLALSHMAATEGLDFDGVTARMRDWVDEPVALDPARPVGTEAVQVMTVHQAKGLEFPVVVIWDGVGEWKAYEQMPVWGVDRNGAGWALSLHGLKWEEPRTLGWLDRARLFAEAEKKRLVYVAATRARDLLVVPQPDKEGKYFAASLLEGASPKLVHSMEPFREGKGALWSKGLGPSKPEVPKVRADLEEETLKRWREGEAESRAPRFAPAAVSVLAHAEREEETPRGDDVAGESEPLPRKKRPGRYGPTFGETVHRAIGLVLRHGCAASEAVDRAARVTGLDGLRAEAAADVDRAITALEREGMGRAASPKVEYPVATAANGGLVVGYIDLICMKDDVTTIVDFKTDAAPQGDAIGTYPDYARQVKAYGRMVGAPKTRCALLFTETGEMCWVTP